MKLKERMNYAEEQLEKGNIDTVEDYMDILKGTYEDQIEDKINALEQYLLSRRLFLVRGDK